MQWEKKHKCVGFIFSFLFIISAWFGGCIESDEITYINGNIGKIQVIGATEHVSIDEYYFETLVYNVSTKNVDSCQGIIYNDLVVSYKITGNVTNIAGKEITRVNLAFRFYGGISKGVFILHSSVQESFYVEPGETWSYDARFEKINPRFTKINFFDVDITTEME